VAVSLAGALSVFALIFNLDRLFPDLNAVRATSAVMSKPPRNALSAHARVLIVEARAYPLEQMVISQHLVHDIVGSVPVAVTNGALCRTDLFFRSEDGGEQMFFEVVGAFHRNLLMEDDRTNTLWQQATGEAVFGPLAEKTLKMLPSMQMPRMLPRHEPRTTMAVEPEGAPFVVLATRTGFRLLEMATQHVTAPGHMRPSKLR
jgi:hypothetical protein